MAGQPRTFQSKKQNKAVVFIGVAAIIAILVFILISYAINTFRIYTVVPDYFRYVIACVVGLASGALASIAAKQTIIVIDEESFTYTKGKKVEKYPLDSFAGTNVVRNYMNGAYTGSTRYIRFKTPDYKIRQIEIPFEEKDYSDIVSLIKKNNANSISEEEKEEIREAFEGERRINIPRDELLKSFSKSRKARAAFSIITLVISLTVCIASYILMDIWCFLAMLVMFGLLGPTLAIAIFLYGRKESIAAMKSTPSLFTAGPDSISFDDDVIPASAISGIVVTPPSYNSTGKDYEFRKVVITDNSGVDHTYYFGKTLKGNKKMSLKEYTGVVTLLEIWSFSNNIEFRQDLG